MRTGVSVHRVHGVWFALQWVVLGPVMRFDCCTVMLVARDVLECVSAVGLACARVRIVCVRARVRAAAVGWVVCCVD